jgi:hypothetical protein
MLEMLKKVFGKKDSVEQKKDCTTLTSRVECDDTGIKVVHPNGTVESSRWDEIIKVSVITTDQGPFVDDVFLALFKEDKGCIIPSTVHGYNDAYEIVSKFEGFDFSKYIESMSSTSNNEFICWHK